MSDVPVEVWSEGEPVILLHGSGAPAPVSAIWSRQRPLAERYRLIIPTRRGYGDRPVAMQTDIEGDVADLLSLLGEGAGEREVRATSGSESADAQRPQAPAAEGAHLVGFSYGGIVALTAAARRPDLVRSLTVIEPPALGIARGHPAADHSIESLSRFEPPPPGLTPEQFWKSFRAMMGMPVPEQVTLTPIERKAVEAHMAEAPPFTLSLPLDELAATSFPKIVISGDWNAGMDAVADIITERLSAERFVLKGWYHNVHRGGEPFNQRLEAFLQAASEM
ncbi:MAG TPA: alpha/beta hydrolase [Ktedonobacterales bacterium]|nr:alpha/beta hydrolase [Ktedonobacterales bacterium]